MYVPKGTPLHVDDVASSEAFGLRTKGSFRSLAFALALPEQRAMLKAASCPKGLKIQFYYFMALGPQCHSDYSIGAPKII